MTFLVFPLKLQLLFRISGFLYIFTRATFVLQKCRNDVDKMS